MRKTRLAFRWAITFTILTLFTAQSLALLGFGDNKAYAHTIEKSEHFKKENRFIRVDSHDLDDDERSDHRGKHKDKKKRNMVCTLSQGQLDSLRDFYPTQVQTIQLSGDRSISLAVVDGDNNTNKRDIYRAIGLSDRGKRCAIVEQNRTFFLFLLPGVS